jgi:hypothetical protein
LFERAKKRLARILMHLLTVQIEGTAESVLTKSTLWEFSKQALSYTLLSELLIAASRSVLA